MEKIKLTDGLLKAPNQQQKFKTLIHLPLQKTRSFYH